MASMPLITADRYNQLQATVNTVLGVGAGDTGYGIRLTSTQIQRSDIVTATDINKLRTDMLSIYVHQNGNSAGFPANLEKQITEIVNEEDYSTLVENINQLLTNRNQSSFPQTSEIKTTSIRNNPWGGFAQAQSVFHEVKVEFASPDARRHFFNTGGAIQFEASLTSFSGGDKSNDWSNMFDALEKISFKSRETSTIGSGTAQSIGNFDLTQNYQTIYSISGFDFPDNTYVIKAKSIDTAAISFLIEFNDFDASTIPGNDQPVNGTLTSTVSQIRATGNNVAGAVNVIVPSPQYINLREVSFSVSPPQSFSITPSSTLVNEGSSITFNVETSLVADDTILYWTTKQINGSITQNDFVDNQLSGSVTVVNNKGTIVREIRNDNLTEGNEQFQLQIRTESTNGPIRATSNTVTIIDTSANIPAPPPAPAIICPIGQSASRRTGFRWRGRFTNTYTLEFGTAIGRAGIDFDAGNWARDSFTITWNGQTVSTGDVRRRGSLTFNKTSTFPTTATLTVRSPRWSFWSWHIRCPH